MKVTITSPADPDVSVVQEYGARDRAASLAVAPVVLRLYRRRGPAGLERGAFRRFAERLGLSAAHAMRLVHLGIALEKFTALGEFVREGLVPVEAGATLGQALTEPGVVRTGDRWVEWAQTMSTQELRNLFFERRDVARSGGPVYTVVAHLTPRAKDDLDRCRRLVSRGSTVIATVGQTIAVLADEWRRRHDPLLRRAGKRRVPPTRTVRGSRYVPRAVDREVRARSDDRCRGPFCDNAVWVQRSHRRAHAKGGDREANNLDLLCEACHKQYEAGLFLISGDPGSPVFTSPDGKPLDRRVAYRAGSDPDAAVRWKQTLTRSASPAGNADPSESSVSRRPPAERDHGPPPGAADLPPARPEAETSAAPAGGDEVIADGAGPPSPRPGCDPPC